MKNITKISKVLLVGLVVVGMFGVAGIVSARTPSLSLYSQNGGDLVQISVYGDSYAQATLYYQQNGYGTQSRYLGATDSSGYLYTSVNSSTLNVVSGSNAYVIVNSQQSSTVTWPTTNNNNNYYGNISLSQSSVTLSVGQSVNITVYGGSTPYTMYTTNGSNVFQSAIGSNTLNVWGVSQGSGSLNVCSSGGSPCATLSVTVTGNNYNYNYNYSNVTFSQNNVTLLQGGSTNVTIYGGGSYYISSNSNSNAVNASISGSNLYLYGSNYGTATITVCQQNYGQCGTVTATVNYGGSGGYYNYASPVTFSPSSATLTVGQSTTTTIYGGGSSSYYVAYNSNPNTISASVTSNKLTVSGNATIAGVVVVCSTSTSCGAFTVSISGNNYNYYNYNYNYNSGNWTFCSNENQYCYLNGSQLVRYGANGLYYYKTMYGTFRCSNSTFGDPIFGTIKQCYFGGTI